jgi:hypothetical protein
LKKGYSPWGDLASGRFSSGDGGSSISEHQRRSR